MLDWLRKRKSGPQSLRVQQITFVGDQDGDIERQLKTRLIARFQENIRLAEAYLVRVRYGDPSAINVALCLKTIDGQADYEVVEVAHSEFAQIFAHTVSLDILFLTPAQELEVSRVARPFYRQATSARSQQ